MAYAAQTPRAAGNLFGTARPSERRAVKGRNAVEKESLDTLFLLATQRFCNGTPDEALTHQQYKDAFHMLINTVGEKTKQMAAEQLAVCPYAPREIVLYLALEPIETARPVISKSRVLSQLDLMRTVNIKGVDHGRTIAERMDLGPTLIARLQDFKDRRLDARLAANRALALDDQPARLSGLFKLRDVRGQDHDLPITEQKAKAADATKPASIKAAVQPKSEPTRNAARELFNAASRGGRLRGTLPQQTSQAFRQESLGDALENAAASGNSQELCSHMQDSFDLSLPTTHQVLDDKSGDTLCVLMKAAEIGDAQANRILMLTFPNIGLAVENAARSIHFYANLTVEGCQKAVDQWPKRSEPRSVHQPYQVDDNAKQRPPRQTAHFHAVADRSTSTNALERLSG